jgi:cytochrome P450
MLSARDDEGRPFSGDVIFGNLMTMLLAGDDTTAYTLGWAVHQLCDSPEWVMELRREADELRRAIPITSPRPVTSGTAAGSANTPARTTYRRTFRLVPVLAFVPAAVSPCSR